MNVRRKNKGSSIAEVAPSLIILVIILFPMINLLGLGASYGAGWYLNFLQVREAALSSVVRSGAIVNGDIVQESLNTVRADWEKSPVRRLAKAEDISEEISLTTDSIAEGSRGLAFVQVTTSMALNPLIPVPFVSSVPGLNAPFAVKYTSNRPVEDVI